MTPKNNEIPQESMPSIYDPQEIEEKRYSWWEEKGYFKPHRNNQANQPTFTIMMPPPNVTGQLHLGHALTATIEDTLIRWHRMLGDETLWLPGTDHAGIATQYIVEQAIQKEGLDRREIGREEFLKRVWLWVEEYGDKIQKQHRRLGVSADWSRETFTLDEKPSLAVRTTFKNLFDKKLIYRGDRIINWCPKDLTALSDLEIEYEDSEGSLWHIKYPLLNKPNVSIIVATTRPETLLGDVAVAVNTKDVRYKDLIGEYIKLPLTNRTIPIIADEYVDIKFGTGALKITPAHDPNDFEIGKRHNFPPLNVMNPNGTMNESAGSYSGMDRFKARTSIVSDLKDLDLLEKIEPYDNRVGHCYRCNEIVEPRASIQWFVDIQPLAKPAIQAVKDDQISIVPERFTQIYMNWMENIRDWCISRQLWWGHRIPVWYCTKCDGNQLTVTLNSLEEETPSTTRKEFLFSELIEKGLPYDQILTDAERINPSEEASPIVETEKPIGCPICGESNLVQDPDVLDTWFSSGLWPHSTLGWPEKGSDLNRYYPTSVLETGYDILFFWVARMIMLGIENTGDVPFKTVYLHGLVRDANKQKMSKTKGNVIDPIETISEYGTDALRMALTISTAPGNDLALPKSRLEAGRNFANKLWNGARFVIQTIEKDPSLTHPQVPSIGNLEDRWISSRLQTITQTTQKMLESFQIGQAEQALRDFLWDEFFDWYLELAKIRIREGDESSKYYLVTVLEQSLRLLHPFMPYVTEEIWQNLIRTVPEVSRDQDSIMVSKYPEVDLSLIDLESELKMTKIFEIIKTIRNIRAELNITPSREIEVFILCEEDKDFIFAESSSIKSLARLSNLNILSKEDPQPESKTSVTTILDKVSVIVPFMDLLDPELEITRLSEEITSLDKRITSISQRLSNDSFKNKAPQNVIDKESERLKESKEKIEALKEQREKFL